MTERVTGGCKCGKVRLEGTLLDAPMFRCHCRDCQQLTGGGHSEMVPLAKADFQITEGYSTYAMQGGSGRSTFSRFCPTCGAQLTRNSERMADRIYVHAGALDDPTRYAPSRSIYTDAAQPWDRASVIDDTAD